MVGQAGLVFLPLSEADPVRPPALHVKGFTYGLNLNEKASRTAVAEIIALVNEEGVKTIVFDGDPFDNTGFTAVLDELTTETNTDLVAFALDAPGKARRHEYTNR